MHTNTAALLIIEIKKKQIYPVMWNAYLYYGPSARWGIMQQNAYGMLRRQSQ